MNAVRHGLRAEQVIVAALEKADDWEGHRDGVLTILAPVGFLEETLAERVALILWRLGRVTRFEREAVSLRQESVEQDFAEARKYKAPSDERNASEVRLAARVTAELVKTFERLSTLDDAALVSGDEAAAVMYAVAEAVDDDDFDFEKLRLPGVPDDSDMEEFDGWTAGQVRRGIAAIAKASKRRPGVLIEAVRAKARVAMRAKRSAVKVVTAELARMRRARVLPTGDDLDKLTRYESHLERSLYKALHELQRLQAARLGERVLPPVAVDLDISQDC